MRAPRDPSPVDDDRPTIAVLGAGPYGIAAARALRDLGHDPIILERGAAPADTWRGRHDHLRLNTIRWLSHLPGVRIPRRFGGFPSRDDFVDYLDEVATDLDIRTSTPVDRIDRQGDGWTIATPDGPLDVDHVLVATGPDTEPVIPHWPGEDEFGGDLMHAADFDRLADADGRSVLVVGPGNSGVDLMNHLVDGGATNLMMSARHGMNILPERMFGVPTHPMAVAGRRLPADVQDAMMRSLQRVAFGDLTEYGYPASDLGVLARIDRDQIAPAIDNGFVDALESGRVTMHPAIERFDHDRVVFEDGSTETPDLVVCATGYRPGLDKLVGHVVELDGFGFPRLTSEFQVDGLPGLWFFGMDRDPYGNLSVLRARTRRLYNALEEQLGEHPDHGTPRRIASRIESTRMVPDATDTEKFRGFAVMGLPFASGDLLAMRRFPGSTVGPGYTSVWHRSPSGRWTFYQDQEPLVACPRAFGPAIDDAIVTDVALEWTSTDEFQIAIDDPVRLSWTIRLASTPVTRALSAVVSASPDRVRLSRPFAELAGRIAGIALGAGRMRLVGDVPSGQTFHADMRQVWTIDRSHATIEGRDLGAVVPLPEQVHLGDFWIPQRGLFAFGDGLFDAYDPAEHVRAATRHEASRSASPMALAR